MVEPGSDFYNQSIKFYCQYVDEQRARLYADEDFDFHFQYSGAFSIHFIHF